MSRENGVVFLYDRDPIGAGHFLLMAGRFQPPLASAAGGGRAVAGAPGGIRVKNFMQRSG